MPKFVVFSCICFVPSHLHRSVFFPCVQFFISVVTFFLFYYYFALSFIFFNDRNGTACVELVVEFLLLSSFIRRSFLQCYFYSN